MVFAASVLYFCSIKARPPKPQEAQKVTVGHIFESQYNKCMHTCTVVRSCEGLYGNMGDMSPSRHLFQGSCTTPPRYFIREIQATNWNRRADFLCR